jgi:hypothetical protein
MFFREVLNEDLGCGSYVVADGGEAVGCFSPLRSQLMTL